MHCSLMSSERLAYVDCRFVSSLHTNDACTESASLTRVCSGDGGCLPDESSTQKLATATGAICFAGTRNTTPSMPSLLICSALSDKYVSAILTVRGPGPRSSLHSASKLNVNSTAGSRTRLLPAGRGLTETVTSSLSIDRRLSAIAGTAMMHSIATKKKILTGLEQFMLHRLRIGRQKTSAIINVRTTGVVYDFRVRLGSGPRR